MKRFAIILLALCTTLTLTLAGCGGGGGGGGGGGNPNPAFTTTQDLAAPDATTPAFSVAIAVDNGAGTAFDPTVAVGAADNGAGTTLQAVVWEVTGSGATLANTATALLPAGGYSRANGVNNLGAIVGEMGSPIVPAFWVNSGIAAVGLDLGGALSGAAYEINNDGMIVGETVAAPVPPSTVGRVSAVTWASSTAVPTPLPDPTTGATGPVTSSSAYAINNNATVTEIVGEFTDNAGTHGVVWRQDPAPATTFTAIVLPDSATLVGDSLALSINDDGNVIGEIEDIDAIMHAVRWNKVGATYSDPQDLGVGSAGDINNGGRVVGSATTATFTGASAWGSGGTVPILMHADLADGIATAIANTGRAVGTVPDGLGNNQAFIALP